MPGQGGQQPSGQPLQHRDMQTLEQQQQQALLEQHQRQALHQQPQALEQRMQALQQQAEAVQRKAKALQQQQQQPQTFHNHHNHQQHQQPQAFHNQQQGMQAPQQQQQSHYQQVEPINQALQRAHSQQQPQSPQLLQPQRVSQFHEAKVAHQGHLQHPQLNPPDQKQQLLCRAAGRGSLFITDAGAIRALPSLTLQQQLQNQQEAPNRMATPVRSMRRVDHSASQKSCNCKNSRCLKLYCECFASGRFCNRCNCVNCYNIDEHKKDRAAAIQAILERNPVAFYPKIADVSEDTKHSKGCNCKKSGCLKKYCECFQAGIYCSNNCKCNECKNFEGSTIRAAVLASMDQREIVEAGKRAAAGGGLAGSHKRHRVMESRPMQMPLHVPMPVSVAQASPEQVMQQIFPGGMQPDGRLPAVSVLQGVVKPEVLRELCRLLLLAADSVKDSAVPAKSEACTGLEATAAAAAGKAMQAKPNGTGTKPDDRSAHGKPSAMYEMQEACVLQEFLGTLVKLVTVGKDKLEQRRAVAQALPAVPMTPPSGAPAWQHRHHAEVQPQLVAQVASNRVFQPAATAPQPAADPQRHLQPVPSAAPPRCIGQASQVATSPSAAAQVSPAIPGAPRQPPSQQARLQPQTTSQQPQPKPLAVGTIAPELFKIKEETRERDEGVTGPPVRLGCRGNWAGAEPPSQTQGRKGASPPALKHQHNG